MAEISLAAGSDSSKSNFQFTYSLGIRDKAYASTLLIEIHSVTH